ncbi:MAG: M28 family metallopeptidase [Oceanihabitans sp.]
MKLVLSILTCIFICSCSQTVTKEKTKNTVQIIDSLAIQKYANSITAAELKTHLSIYASNDFQGRNTGETGQKKAVRFLKNYYQNQNILSPVNDSIYFQYIPENYLPDGTNATENVLAFIKGSSKPEEVLIISAHLDHLGKKADIIFNGADDNGSGTVALMEIAQAFKIAKQNGHSPKRSILFLHLSGEEIGLYGSQYYAENPVFKLNKTIANLNIDMVGRIDKKHKNNPNYLYIIGANRLSQELHDINEKANSSFTQLDLDYTFNAADDVNQFYSRSDHYNFAKHNIPVIFYFNGTHNDFHKETDTAEKINYSLIEKRSKLIFATAWQLANRDNMLKLNANTNSN